MMRDPACSESADASVHMLHLPQPRYCSPRSCFAKCIFLREVLPGMQPERSRRESDETSQETGEDINLASPLRAAAPVPQRKAR